MIWGAAKMIATAAWGAVAPFARFKSTSSVTGEFALPIAGSWQPNTSDQAIQSNSQTGTMSSPAISISGLTGETGYNAGKFTLTVTYKLPAGGISGNTNPFNVNMSDNGGTNYNFNAFVGWNGNNYSVQWGFNFNTQINIPAAAVSKWLQFTISCSNSSSDYLDWNGGSGASYYYRASVFNTETNELIGTVDTNTNDMPWPDYATAFGTTTLPVVFPYSSGNNSVYWNCIGIAGYDTRWAGAAAWFGHMWDIKQNYTDGSNKGYCTSIINGGKAWFNLYTPSTPLGESYGAGYYVYELVATNTDRYTEGSNRLTQISGGKTPAEFAAIFSTTDKPKGVF
jgi:hypothetical protein